MMKPKMPLIAIAALIVSANAFAAARPSLPEACLKKAVAAVNKQHTLAEGASYALREIYNGDSASVILVGHSDETDPTDYLVTIDRRGCKVKSIVWTNDSSGVEEYSDSELIENRWAE